LYKEDGETEVSVDWLSEEMYNIYKEDLMPKKKKKKKKVKKKKKTKKKRK